MVDTKDKEIGKRYNRLVVLEFHHIDKITRNKFYLCQCDCGNKKVISLSSLKNGSTKACGCLRGKKNKWKYLSTEYPDLYKKWDHMKSRCYNPNDISYYNYGNRGIGVCDGWLNSFDQFAEWSFDNGYKKGLEIDRIDNDKGYFPENCRYVSPLKNSRNKRTTLKYKYKGKMLSLGEIASINGINYKTLWQRINRDGLKLEEALY